MLYSAASSCRVAFSSSNQRRCKITRERSSSWPIAAWLVVSFGAPGVIYGQALAGVIMGTLAALWGWRYVANLKEDDATPIRPRPYPNPDRYRSR